MDTESSGSNQQLQESFTDSGSDHEIIDKVDDIAVVKKGRLWKIYKRIVRPGESWKRPGHLDDVRVRIITNVDESKIREISPLADIPITEIELSGSTTSQPGHPSEEETGPPKDWPCAVIPHMKKKEVALVTIKTYKLADAPADGTKPKKIITSVTYHHIEVLDWTKVSDLDKDGNHLKKRLTKGQVDLPARAYDEITYDLSITQGGKEVFKWSQSTPIALPKYPALLDVPPVNSLTGEQIIQSNCVSKLLKSMRLKEKAALHVKADTFKLKENVLKELAAAENSDKIILEATVHSILKVEDVFDKGEILKRILKQGDGKETPGNLSRVALIIRYLIGEGENAKELYKTDAPTPTEEELNNLDTLAEKYPGLLVCYMDEYKMSKCLKLSLKTMKKGEVVDLVVKTRQHIKYGFDFETLKNVNEPATTPLHYFITLLAFSQDRQGYSMTIDEKIEEATRRREIGVNFIKAGNIKKARKTFDKTVSFFEMGNPTQADKEKSRDAHRSALLNLALTQQKLERWKDLLTTADKILVGEPYNLKAIYRKGVALLHLEEFEPARDLLKGALGQITDEATKGDFVALLSQIDQKLAEYKSKQKSVYSKMFK